MLKAFGGFDWDKGNRDKCRKHGVSIDEIEQALCHGAQVILPDIPHSDTEDRFIAVGRTTQGRRVFVAFTYRERDGDTLLRPISARYMRNKEAKRYEQADTEVKER